MTHHHVGGKKKTTQRLQRSLHRIAVLKRKRNEAKAALLESIRRHRAAVQWLAENHLVKRTPGEPLSNLIHRGAIAIHGIRDKVLRHHVEHAFASRIALARAEEKAIRTAKRIKALKARNRQNTRK